MKQSKFSTLFLFTKHGREGHEDNTQSKDCQYKIYEKNITHLYLLNQRLIDQIAFLNLILLHIRALTYIRLRLKSH